MQFLFTDGTINSRTSFYLITDENGNYINHTYCEENRNVCAIELQGILSALLGLQLRLNEPAVVHNDNATAVNYITNEITPKFNSCPKEVFIKLLTDLEKVKILLRENKNISVIWVPRNENLAGIVIRKYLRTRKTKKVSIEKIKLSGNIYHRPADNKFFRNLKKRMRAA